MSHRVAHANVLAGDFLLVVQRGATDGGPVEENRLELGDRCESAGAANLHCNRVELGLRLLGCVFVGHGPAWRLGGGTDAVAQVEAVQLDDSAVGVVVEAGSDAVQLGDGVEDVVHAGAAPRVLWCAETKPAKRVEQAGLRVDRRASDDLTAAVQDDVEGASGHER